jgi:glucosamine-6-phosphate deaminase
MAGVPKTQVNAPLPTSFQADALRVHVLPTHDELAITAATAAARHLQQILAQQPQASVLFASAPSQVRFLACLTSMPGIDWPRVLCFHMDEYLGISESHPASFRRFLREHITQRVHPGTVHYLAGDAEQPLAECTRYATLLRAQPIDLCCLGIGENGHIAFNDPTVADFDDPHTVKLVKLEDACRRQQVGEGAFPTLDAVPRYAYTLTVPTLCAAGRILAIVPEARKAKAVHQALNGPIEPVCPASVLRRQPHALLFLDADSASLVEHPPAS